MGESIVDVSRDEDKMAETAASKPDLEVSVSFGRFANDSLSWEKWSAFSPNKYLEEVEKCATPGSVAQKKAYFEARYKKIAARRAELMDQGNQMEDDPLWSKIENGDDLTGDVRGAGLEFDILNSHGSTQEVVKQETNLIGEGISTNVADLKEDAAISLENLRSYAEMAQEMDSLTDSPESCRPEKAIVVEEGEEETALIESKDMNENSNNWDNEIGKGPQVKEEKVKLDHPKESKKVSPANKERNVTRVKKKSALPATKASHISSPKVSKPSPTNTSLSASRSSKKGHDSSLPRSKTPSIVGSEKVAPKSLHMSIGLEPANFEPSSHSTTRKSFIMEEMGDKDIVKRAFKTFQKNVNQLKPSVEERSLGAKQVPMPTKGTEPRVSSSMTSRKENAGSVRAGGTDKKSAKAAPSSFGLKNDEKTRKTNEFSKKLEKKSNVKEVTRTGLQSKSKEEKGVEIRKLRQCLNFKATPLPAFYGALKMSKSALDKEVSKK